MINDVRTGISAVHLLRIGLRLMDPSKEPMGKVIEIKVALNPN